MNTGTFPHWMPYGNLGGKHLAADPMLGLFYPPNWLVYAIGSLVSVETYVRLIYVFLVGHTVVGGIATALFARSFADLEWPYAVLAGLVYETAGFVIVYLIAPPHTIAFALAPAVLYAWDRALKRSDRRFVGLAAILLGFSLLGGYQFVPAFVVGPAMVMLLVYRYPPWSTARSVSKRYWLWLSAIVFLSLAMFVVQAVPSYVAYQSSYRPAVASLAWSGMYNFGFERFYQLLVPSLLGKYWIGYVGLLPIAMLVIAVFRPDLRDRPITVSVIMAGGGLLLAAGTQTLLHQWTYVTVPGLGRWRSIYHYFIWFVIFGSVVTGGVTQQLVRAGRDEKLLGQLRRSIPWLLVPTILGVIALTTVQAIDPGGNLLATGSEMTGVVRAWGVFAVSLVVVVAGLYTFARRPERRYVALLAVVLVLDAGMHVPLVEQRSDTSPTELFGENELTHTLSNATETTPPSRARFFPKVPYRWYSGQYDVHPVKGYDPLPPPEATRMTVAMYHPPENADAFNLQYRIWDEELNTTNDSVWQHYATVQSADGFWIEQPRGWERTREKLWIYHNPDVKSRSFSVPRVQTAPSAGYRSQLDALDRIDPRRTAIVDPDSMPAWAPNNGTFTNGSVQITEYSRHSIALRVESDGPMFVLLSDAYHPWWRASIDGEQTEVVRTDARFRGVFVPAGAQEVTLRFDRTPFYAGALLSLLALLAAIALAVRSGRG
jgi:hypothetical protein